MKKIFLVLICFLTILPTITRTIRAPNDFAQAHWLIDYRFGFVKRGFVGTMVSLFANISNQPVTAQLIFFFSSLIFIVFLLTLMFIALRVIVRTNESTSVVFPLIVFFTSPFIVMSAHLFGYFDNLIVILTVASLVSFNKNKFWLSAIFQSLSILVHESSLLIGFPVFLFAWIIRYPKQRPSINKFRWIAILLLPIGTFLAIVLVPNYFLPTNFQELLAQHLSGYSFVQENRAQLVSSYMSIGLIDWLKIEGHLFFERLVSFQMILLVVPSAITILLSLHFWGASKNLSSLESLLVIAVCVSPLLLHAVAWDTPRIWTYTIVTAFLGLYVFVENFPINCHLPKFAKIIFLTIFIYNCISLTPLMDGEIDHFDLKSRLILYSPVIFFSLLLHIPKVQKYLNLRANI